VLHQPQQHSQQCMVRVHELIVLCCSCRQWLSRVAPLLGDKSQEMRRKAHDVVAALVKQMEAASAVGAYAQHASGAEAVGSWSVQLSWACLG
jgi:hypothetical protein